MKIEYTEGCTVSCIDVDGDDIQDISPAKKAELKRRLVSYLDNKKLSEDELQDLLLWMTERYGITEFDYHCDTCNDDVFTTTLTI